MRGMMMLGVAVLGPALAACAASTDGPGGGDPVDAGRDAEAVEVDASVDDARCGDLVCAEDVEDCESCPLDCGECPACDMAPTCTGALAVPVATEPLASFDNTTPEGEERVSYVCGTDLGVAPDETNCADPQLRIRLKHISIERGNTDIRRHLFCVISAEDGLHSELLLTPPREVAGGGETTRINLSPSEGTLWGQGDLYRSISNITITYTCFLTSDAEAAQGVLDDIAGRAAEVSEHADGYGWVFGAVSVLSTVIGSSLGTVSDRQILDVQQTIAADALLELTNGRTWDIRSKDGNLLFHNAHDLRLSIESWGCAEVRDTFD